MILYEEKMWISFTFYKKKIGIERKRKKMKKRAEEMMEENGQQKEKRMMENQNRIGIDREWIAHTRSTKK